MKTAQNTWGRIRAKLKDAAGPTQEDPDDDDGKSTRTAISPTLLWVKHSLTYYFYSSRAEDAESEGDAQEARVS